MLSTEYQSESEAERRQKWVRMTRVFTPTGEIVGVTEWRRWRTANGWHPDTPASIRSKYDWLFDSSLPMPEGDRDA